MTTDSNIRPGNFISLAALVGATLGAMEIARIISHPRSVSPLELVFLFIYACGGYAIVSAIAALLFIAARRLATKLTMDPATAIGIAFGTFLSIRFLWWIAALREPKLAWLTPGCLVSGAICGWLVKIFVARGR